VEKLAVCDYYFLLLVAFALSKVVPGSFVDKWRRFSMLDFPSIAQPTPSERMQLVSVFLLLTSDVFCR